jgi:hypothetical protein
MILRDYFLRKGLYRVSPAAGNAQKHFIKINFAELKIVFRFVD